MLGEDSPGVRQQHSTAEDGSRDVEVLMHLPQEHLPRPLAAPKPARGRAHWAADWSGESLEAFQPHRLESRVAPGGERIPYSHCCMLF